MLNSLSKERYFHGNKYLRYVLDFYTNARFRSIVKLRSTQKTFVLLFFSFSKPTLTLLKSLFRQIWSKLIYLKLLNIRSKICGQSLSHSYFLWYYRPDVTFWMFAGGGLPKSKKLEQGRGGGSKFRSFNFGQRCTDLPLKVDHLLSSYCLDKV